MSVHEIRSNPSCKSLSWPTDDLGLFDEGFTPEFKGEFLGPVLPIVEDLARAISVPVDYVAHALIGVAASLLSGRVCVRPFPTSDWRERPILWFALVGHPSTRKSPALDSVVKPLTLLQHQISEKLAKQRRAVSKLGGSNATSADPGCMPSPDPEASKGQRERSDMRERRLFVQDATMESICDVAADNPEGLLIIRDELSGWLNTRDRYHPGSAPFYMEGYQGNSFTVDRRSREDTLFIPSLCLSILGTIQPDLVDPIFAGPQDGCAARMLFIWPQPRTFELPDKYTDHSKTLFDIYRTLNSIRFDREAPFPFAPREIPLTADAAQHFAAWLLEHERDSAQTGGHYGAFMGKAAGMVLRVALTAEFVKAALGSNTRLSAVTLETTQQVIRWMDDYMKPMMLKVLGDAAVDRDVLNAQALLRYVSIGLFGSFNKRAFMRAPHKKHFPDIRSSRDMDRALYILEDHGWIRPIVSDGPGRKRSDFEVNRKVRTLRDKLLGFAGV